MKIIHFSKAESHRFESDSVKGVTGRILIGKADGAENFCMRFFELSPGGFTPQHAHEWEHEIFFHSGRGDVLNCGKWVPITKGSVVFIPGNEVHQIRSAPNESVGFVCLIPSGAPEL